MTANRIAILVTLGGSALAAACALASLAGLALPWAPLALLGAAASLVGALLWWRHDREPVPVWQAGPASETESPAPTAAGRGRESDEVLGLRSEIERRKAMEQDLIAAKQAAEAAMMSKGEFLATMSHEIRTPLNGIIPLLDILLSSQLGPDQRDYVQTAYGSARQLLRIVDDILDYSKLEASKLELETVGLNLREVLEGVKRLMEKPAESKHIALNLTIDPAVRLAVRGDPVRLRQVLTNLVSNAIKFTERGSVSISVTRRGETRSHHELRFEVKDTGVGISPEAAAKLFKPFSQADASTTRTFGGTGLGLVICKRIVDLMNGQIGVESELGRGSTFWFQIPLMKAVGDMGSARRHGLQGARVLVLTSDPVQLRRLSVSIPQWGATPVPASSTQEALNKLRAAAARADTWNYEVLLVDVPSVRTTVVGLHRNLLREPGMDELRLVYLQGDEAPPPEIVGNSRVLVLPRTTTDGDLRQLITRHIEEANTQLKAGPSSPEVVVSAPGTPPSQQGGLNGHVLLVEDNPVNRQVASRLLTLSGLSLDSAENGQEAVDMAAQRDYDAILMDCQMPVMDGYTATRELRRREQAQGGRLRIPIIAMTANAMVGDREKCLDAGMDDYLSKPLNRMLLEQTLRNWLEQARKRKQEASANVTPLAAARRTPVADPAAEATAAAPRAPAPARPSPAAPAPTPAAAPAPVAATPPPSAAAPARRAAPASANKAPPIQKDIVDDLRDIMGAEFNSLVAVFLEDAPKSIEKLSAAAAKADIDALIGPAHSLKSTSANLGAMELSALAKRIEIGARQRVIENPVVLVDELSNEFRRVDQALRAL